MYLTIDGLFDLANPIALIALLAVPFGAAHRRIASLPLRQMVLGTVFGVMAAAAMMNPVHLDAGIIFDIRALPIGLAGAFLGPLGALPAALIGAATRIWIGGVGTGPGIVCIVLAALLGMFAFALEKRLGSINTVLKLAALGPLIALSYVGILLLPAEIAERALRGVVPLSVVLTIIGTAVVGALLTREQNAARRERNLSHETTTDPLTGIANRRGFLRALHQALQNVGVRGNALLVLDIDHFKAINDTHGHDVGDRVLKQLSHRLSHRLRGNDLIARFGGEEFVIYLPWTSRKAAAAVAERLRRSVAEDTISVADCSVRATVSIGVCWDAAPIEVEQAFREADRALYAAKAGGRNRVAFSEGAQAPEAIRVVRAA